MKYIYGVLCILGTILPYSVFLPWLAESGPNVFLLYTQISTNPLSSVAWLDVIVSAFVLVTFIIYEGRQLKINRLWLPILSTFIVGVSLGLPLFLLMRELHLEKAKI
ncbi:DUF2834 domain-containing protein [Pseudoalteromonas luteoviolacea]|uniref:DUF2834 domain-containing protein n=1 Tax=Pseudoalteromonas luteoviolacea S4054 TaxID=1129367 RepID=A0A0F6AEB1_9GAMM|nr:DUF2834 domain-containing protein [Pseudoalteromonas luteoviolacea]AOT08112.1 hypothetical protein S4054249_09760 [Pseudoalteromonas luteoviolacea]AOT13029.1 hypothetical protein S40542_09760 [Pseudoalteromonas luteoviolacea]AOT17941.1 hypothetical protein S4054_09755 [Pseudoalteromonas luteoviolacea]KKE84498.1 hypothetical protein N479_08730 [Pseudoalteromonas luteoviolacea S4054]KZN69528.1 hypothetical protein N481_22310 [Pseudoalteromonas luteoviolacea S4047-1]